MFHLLRYREYCQKYRPYLDVAIWCNVLWRHKVQCDAELVRVMYSVWHIVTYFDTHDEQLVRVMYSVWRIVTYFDTHDVELVRVMYPVWCIVTYIVTTWCSVSKSDVLSVTHCDVFWYMWCGVNKSDVPSVMHCDVYCDNVRQCQ